MSFEPRCPLCRQVVVWEGNPHRPFCSDRCRMVDLGVWMAEGYQVPGEATDPDTDDDG